MTRHHQQDRSWKSGRLQQGQRETSGPRGQNRQGQDDSLYGEPSYADTYSRNDEAFYMGRDDNEVRSTSDFNVRSGLEGSGGWDNGRVQSDRSLNDHMGGDRSYNDRSRNDSSQNDRYSTSPRDRYSNERYNSGYGERSGNDRFGNDQRYSYNDRFGGADRFSGSDRYAQGDSPSMGRDSASMGQQYSARPTSNEPNHNFNWTQNRRSQNANQSQGQEQTNYSGKGPKGFKRSDERLHEEICERLTHHAGIDATDVEVTVKGGVVTLSGEVSERRAKRMIAEEVEDIWGVSDVNNELKVRAANMSSEKSEVQGFATTAGKLGLEAQKATGSRTQPAQ